MTTATMTPPDAFQMTADWYSQALRDGTRGRMMVYGDLMERYAHPLRVYFLGSNCRRLGEPDEVVNGFFVDRLSKPDYLHKWIEQRDAKGMRLRRWLMNGLSFYLKELRAQARRNGRIAAAEMQDVAVSDHIEADFDRAIATTFVQRAMELAQADCAERDLATHWQIFLRHHRDEVPFAEIAPEFGETPARAQVMSRTAAHRFRAALQEILLDDGVDESDIDHEIQNLLAATGS